MKKENNINEENNDEKINESENVVGVTTKNR